MRFVPKGPRITAEIEKRLTPNCAISLNVINDKRQAITAMPAGWQRANRIFRRDSSLRRAFAGQVRSTAAHGFTGAEAT